MAIPLNVSGAFHSSLMKPAREELADKLNSIQISNINIPLYSNVNAKPTMKGSEIKESLISQLESPVLWFDTINNMVSKGNLDFLEVGPGKVLTGLNKKINRKPNEPPIATDRNLKSVVELLVSLVQISGTQKITKPKKIERSRCLSFSYRNLMSLTVLNKPIIAPDRKIKIR